MDAAAELGWKPVSKHQIQPEYGDEQACARRDCRTCLARQNSQARTTRTGKFIFSVQLTTIRIDNLTRLIHTLAICVTIHTYIYIRNEVVTISIYLIYVFREDIEKGRNRLFWGILKKGPENAFLCLVWVKMTFKQDYNHTSYSTIEQWSKPPLESFISLKAAVNTVVWILSNSCMFFWVFRFAKNTNWDSFFPMRIFLVQFRFSPLPCTTTLKQQSDLGACCTLNFPLPDVSTSILPECMFTAVQVFC